MPRNDDLFDLMKEVTEGTYIKEAANEWSALELAVVELKQRLMDKIDKADPKYDEVFTGFETLLASITSANRSSDEGAAAEPEVPEILPEEGTDGQPPVEGMEDEVEEPSMAESVLSEKDDKKKEEPWADGRSHDEAVKLIVRDAWKEIFADGKFKGEGEPTRDDVMKEVEFQSKHGLDHREDASAIRYDAFKKVMKKVKNIAKKLDSEDETTPEEEDEGAKAEFEGPKPFIGMKT